MLAVIDGTLLAGFALAVAAAVAYDTGYALQAFEARRSPPERAMRLGLLAYLARRPIWLAAIGLAIAGWVLQVLALGKAPLTLVQPVLALGLFILLALGARMLHEPVGVREWVAVALIVAAVAVIAVASPEHPGTVVGGAGLAVALGALVTLTALPFALGVRRAPPVALLIVSAGAADGLAAFVAKLVSQELDSGRVGIAALWATGSGAAVLVGLISESSALQRVAATRVAPTVLVCQITIPVILATVVGGESWSSTPLGGVVLAGAFVLLAAAVAILAGSPAVAGVLSEEPPAVGQPASPTITSAAAGSSANEPSGTPGAASARSSAAPSSG
jgi:drug/metabolite transporter (DMT)-like permease